MPVYTTSDIVTQGFVRTKLEVPTVNEIIDECESEIKDDLGYTPPSSDKTMALTVNLSAANIIQSRDPSSIAIGQFRINNDPRVQR